MSKRNTVLFGFMFLCQWICAQNDSVMRLEEVEISDRQLKHFSHTQTVKTLNDSIISKNQATLTALLNYNSNIYFKENGPGMVSSPSFRGTTAQQTAVVWNGININSQFNGQTDFNTISAKDFGSVSIRSGGGSVVYGSSAIGGTVHLNNALRFERRFDNTVDAIYGSFNTLGLNFQSAVGNEKISAVVSISRNSSDNDFDLPDGRKNTNGEFHSTSFTSGVGYRFGNRHTIRWFGYVSNVERHFSLILPSETKTKYLDQNTRNLLEWTAFYGRLTSTAKVAVLTEAYKYYETLATETPNFGKARMVIAKYDASFAFAPKVILNAIADFTNTDGNGSDISPDQRRVIATAVLFSQEIQQNFRYEVGVRREFTDAYDSPILFSAGMVLKANNYTLSWNGSRNFRIPTFNDLYWRDGGNQDLRPESSIQTEIGNELQIGKLKLSLTGYLINIDDMIQWLPAAGGGWNPVNVNKVRTYGIESGFGWTAIVGPHSFAFSGGYAYTVSKNRQTRHQLIYVPNHKATAAAAWNWRRISVDCQLVFTGEVFTRSDNNPRYNIDSYEVSNLSFGYAFGKSERLTLGGRVLNLFDEQYQVVERRWFPGRHFQTYLIFKF